MVEHAPVQFPKRQLFCQGTIASKWQGKSWTLLLWHTLMPWGHLLLTDHPLLMARRTSDHALKWSTSSKVWKCTNKYFVSSCHFENLLQESLQFRKQSCCYRSRVHGNARKMPHNSFSLSSIENLLQESLQFRKQSCCYRSRVHGNARKMPHNAFSLSSIENASRCIVNTSDTHGLPLPGHLPTCEQMVIVLPSDMSKTWVYKNYKAACARQ